MLRPRSQQPNSQLSSRGWNLLLKLRTLARSQKNTPLSASESSDVEGDVSYALSATAIGALTSPPPPPPPQPISTEVVENGVIDAVAEDPRSAQTIHWRR